ncbi:hypothetical protein U9M48_002853 [Paspalum notatum var. saurae]|uniref:F-box domain-containing protein n=1 Tax=Paspalum notatum var. saurae TaxID=547442 RepID=A0AAQ3PS89_PASNO
MHPGESSKKAVPPANGSGCSIESMPEGILEHILGFLPAPEAVQTCVLARRWRHLWKSATSLRIGCNGEGYLTPLRKYRELMDHVLLLRGGPPLDTCEFRFGDFQDEDVPRVNLWLRHALMCNARVFSLSVGTGPSPYIELDDLPLASQQLMRLELTWVQVRDSFLNFSSCPFLEHLAFDYCEFLLVTKISSESLKHLIIYSCDIESSTSEHSRIRICAPNLVSLHIEDLTGRTPILESMPSLTNAFVRITTSCHDICNKLLDPNCSQCGCEFCGTSVNVGDGDKCCVLLNGLSEAKDLDLESSPQMFIFKMDLKWSPVFSKLKTLLLNEYWCMPDDFGALTCILEHSPVLEELTLELFYEGRKYKLEMEGSITGDRPATISRHLNIVKVKCQDVDERVVKILNVDALNLFDEMSPGKKGMQVPALGGSGGIDALPDEVLEHILGFLQAEEAGRTSVLARRWRHLWKSVTALHVTCLVKIPHAAPAVWLGGVPEGCR